MPVIGPLIEIANKIPSPWKQILWAAIVLGSAGFLILKTFRFVPHGQEALLTRFGKVVFRGGVPVQKGAGLHIVIPFAENLVYVSVLDRTYDLNQLTVSHRKYGAFNIRATVVFEVANIYDHRYGVEDPVNRITSACEARLRQCLQGAGRKKLNAPEIEAAFRLLIVAVSKEVGLRFKELSITNIEPRDTLAVAGAIASLRPKKLRKLLEAFGVSLSGAQPA